MVFAGFGDTVWSGVALEPAVSVFGVGAGTGVDTGFDAAAGAGGLGDVIGVDAGVLGDFISVGLTGDGFLVRTGAATGVVGAGVRNGRVGIDTDGAFCTFSDTVDGVAGVETAGVATTGTASFLDAVETTGGTSSGSCFTDFGGEPGARFSLGFAGLVALGGLAGLSDAFRDSVLLADFFWF